MNFPQFKGLSGKKLEQVKQAELDKLNTQLSEDGITEFGLFPRSMIAEGEEKDKNLTTANEKITELDGKVTGLQADLSDRDQKLTDAKTAADASAAKITELESKLTAANEKIEKFETENPAGGNNGQAPKSKGDQSTTPKRELTSWEQKALKKVGGSLN